MVATNIDQDYAINTTISRPFDVPDSVYLVQSTLLINDNGEYMINNKKSTKEQLSIRLSREFDKREQVKNVLLVKSDREVAFDDFLTALDQSKAAFKLFYNDLAKQKYALDYADLADSLQVQLKQRHPIALAEDVIE